MRKTPFALGFILLILLVVFNASYLEYMDSRLNPFSMIATHDLILLLVLALIGQNLILIARLRK